MLLKSSVFVSLSFAALLASPSFAQSANAANPVTVTRTFTFPVIGLASTETLQVNVANLATAPSSSTQTASCGGMVSFANASGKPIGTQMKFTVGSGDIFSAPLPFASTGYTNRGEVLATVQQTITFPSTSPCSLALSLETFDSISGVTHAVLANAPTTTPVPVLTPGASIIPPGSSVVSLN